MSADRFTGKLRKAVGLFVPVLFSCFLLLSCSKKEIKIPDTVIPKEKMVQLMVDIHLAEAHSQFNVPFDNTTNLKQEYYKFIFKKYSITYSQLMNSWTFYTQHPEVFSGVYDEVITELSKKQAAAESSRQSIVGSRESVVGSKQSAVSSRQLLVDSLRIAAGRKGVTVSGKR